MNHRSLAVFSSSLRLGGAERVALKLLCGFDRCDVNVDLVLADATGPLRREIPPNINVIDLQAPKTRKAVGRMANYLRSARPDAVLSHMSFANTTTLLARRWARTDTRVVAVEHSHFSSAVEQGKISRLRQHLMRWTYPRADMVVAVSKGAAADLRDRLRLAPNSVQVVHNPVVDDHLLVQTGETPDHPWLLGEGPPVLLAVGRLVKDKDFASLIRAFAQLRRRQTAKLVILGEGDQRESLQRLTVQLGMTNDVSMPGAVPNPAAFMRRAASLVLSSKFEGLGNVLVEALACGCPCVATDCPTGPREVLQGGRYGRLVPLGDIAALTQAMQQSIATEPNRPLLRKRAEAFRVETSVNRYLQLLGFDAYATKVRSKSA